MKKLFNLFIVLCLVVVSSVCLVACGGGKKTFKVGLICLHDESSTYDKN